MDNILLSGVIAELAGILAGSTLGRVQLDADGDLILELVPRQGPPDRVRIAAGPGRSSLYALRGHPPLADQPTPFALRLQEDAVGARLESVEKEPEERVVLFRFAGDRPAGTLVAELLGRSSNLIWLDRQGRVQAAARLLKSDFRAHRPGDPYRPPPAGVGPGILSATGAEVEALAGACEPGERGLERALARGIRGLGSILARELAFQIRMRGRTPADAWEEVGARLRGPDRQPRLYTPLPLEQIPEDAPLLSSTCFVAPWPLECAGELAARSYPRFSDALEALNRLERRWLGLDHSRRDLLSSIEDEERRLRRLAAALEKDLCSARQADQYRLWGDLLVREKGALRLEGETAIVIDRYGAGGEVRIPFDRKLSTRENAEAVFRRYRRAQRAGPHIERRLREVAARLERLEPLAGTVRAARSGAELESLRGERRIAPRGAAQARTLHAPAGEGEGQAQAREYRSSEGWVILVGRGARANERLTFDLAAPHDFWLHAADTPGAHVVVRNPGRRPEIPPRTLQEAAALAAWFSKARGSRSVQVHYTQRRHVRRPRGAPAGQVFLKRFRSVDVKPRGPATS